RMTRSRSQTTQLLRHAALGRALPHGLADDLAEAAVTLLAAGENGAAALLAALLADTAEPPPPRLRFEERRILADGASTLWHGLAVCELALAEKKDIHIRRPDQPMLLLAVALLAAARYDTRILLSFNNDGDGGDNDKDNDGDNDGTTMRLSLPPPEGQLRLPRAVPEQPAVAVLQVASEPAAGETKKAAETLTAPRRFSLAPDLQSRLETLAQNAFVPPSGTSRATGAGAGQIDND
ncbi:MAG: hypothetical protein MPJ52_01970, partial [Alphaproteobacteria bacterium]|nr:hypothetical protein [Alphaproteobacteria bacterium]